MLSEGDGRIVSLELMWRADPSVAEVADLAPGWVAWRKALRGVRRWESVAPDGARPGVAADHTAPEGRGGAVARFPF